ncbi:MAG: hypothetical protein ABIL58_24260 [Pseudomonadota bacterium]
MEKQKTSSLKVHERHLAGLWLSFLQHLRASLREDPGQVIFKRFHTDGRCRPVRRKMYQAKAHIALHVTFQ